MEIKIAEKKDYSKIKELYNQEGWTRFLNDDLELALDHSIVLVACIENQVIGFVRALC